MNIAISEALCLSAATPKSIIDGEIADACAIACCVVVVGAGCAIGVGFRDEAIAPRKISQAIA